jgi:hypothetical protein
MEHRKVAKLLRKQITEVIQNLKPFNGIYSHKDLLETTEKTSGAHYLPTGGLLFEFYIMVFGSQADSRLIFRGTNPRNRNRANTNNRTLKEYLVHEYTPRFFHLF